MRRIRITAGAVSAEATLNNSFTADAVWNALPIQGSVNRWGEEIYFGIPVKAKQAPDARDVLEMGELGYWPPGSGFCIFFGVTPASRGEEIRAASPVNVFGRVEGDAGVFTRVPDGQAIRIEKIEP